MKCEHVINYSTPTNITKVFCTKCGNSIATTLDSIEKTTTFFKHAEFTEGELLAKRKQNNHDINWLNWYTDLRRNGSV